MSSSFLRIQTIAKRKSSNFVTLHLCDTVYVSKRIHKVKNGEQRFGYGLLECRRIGGMPKQKTLLNLGGDFDIAEADWPTVTRGVGATLRGQNRLPLEDERIARAIDDIVRRLHKKDYDVNTGLDDQDAILTGQVHHPDSRTAEDERVGLQVLEQLGFAALLRAADMKDEHARMAIALVGARMMSSGNEAHTYRWMMNTSTVLELVALEAPSLSTWYQIGVAPFLAAGWQ